MIYPSIGWFENYGYIYRKPYTIAKLLEKQWLTRYPWNELTTYEECGDFIYHHLQYELVKKMY